MRFGVFLAAHDIDHHRSEGQLYDDLLEQARAAEEFGFDYVWLPEHDLVRYIVTPDSLQLAVLIAQQTKRIQIGTAVLVTPFYHPLLLAGDIAQADHLTGGRLDIGLGRGGSPFELRQLQVALPEDAAKRRFAEFVEVLTSVWSSEHAIAFEGEFFSFDNAYVVPRPRSDLRRRLWLAATTTASVSSYAKLGFNIQFTAFRRPISAIVEAAAAFQAERPPGPSQFMVNRNTYVAPTMDEAREILEVLDHHERVIRAGRLDAERVRDGVRRWDESMVSGMSDQEFVHNLPIGDPETVLDKLREYEAAGVDHYSVYTALGQGQAEILRSMELFGRHVIPALRSEPAFGLHK